MLDLILIIMLVISLFKPDVLLSRKAKEYATEKQKKKLIRNLRIIYVLFVAMFESLSIIRHYAPVGVSLSAIFFILFLAFAMPASFRNSKIMKQLGVDDLEPVENEEKAEKWKLEHENSTQEQSIEEQYNSESQDSPIKLK